MGGIGLFKGLQALNRINATDETVYYYVQYEVNDKRQHNEIVDVTTWTGYKEGSSSCWVYAKRLL